MTRYAKRTDKTHAAIRDGLREAGYTVHDYSKVGYGIPDLIVCYDRKCVWLEVKSSPRDGLSKAEANFADHCPSGPPLIAWSLETAIARLQAHGLTIK